MDEGEERIWLTQLRFQPYRFTNIFEFKLPFYTLYKVSSKSHQYINKVWCLDNLDSETSVPQKSVLPNGFQNIAIVHGIGVKVKAKKTQYEFESGAYLCGQMTSKVEISIKELTKITLIQLHPWTTSKLLRIDGFTDEIRPIDDNFLGREISLNHNFVKHPENLVDAINTHFDNTVSDSVKSIVEKVCQSVLAVQGKCRVADILQDYDYSKRTIQTTFKKSIGLSLKQYMDIVRLRSAVDSVRSDKYDIEGGGATVALDHQYFDQSHLVKTFKKIIKITPSKFDTTNFVMPPKDL